jgi:hypothetical protein
MAMNRTDLSRVRVFAPETATASAPAQRRSREAALFERYRQLAAAAAAEEQAEHDAAADADDADNDAAHDADRDEAQAEALAMQAAHAVHSLAVYAGLHAGRYGGGGTATLASSSSSPAALFAPPGQRETPQRGDQQSDADDRGSQQHDGDESNRGNGGQQGDGSDTPQPGASRSMSTASVQAVRMQAASTQASVGSAASRSVASASPASEPVASRSALPAMTASQSPTPQPAAPATTTATTSAFRCMQVTALSATAPDGSPRPHLLDYLVSQTAGFCTNPAALARGNWQLSLSLDPQQLPECDLHVSLSHFDLVLRFDTVHPQSRQLISVHAATLRERLAALLAQSAPHRPRNIEITVS